MMRNFEKWAVVVGFGLGTMTLITTETLEEATTALTLLAKYYPDCWIERYARLSGSML